MKDGSCGTPWDSDPARYSPGGTDFCLEKVSGIPAGGDSGGPVMSIGARGKETLLGVFYGSDREKMAGAAEIAQQLAWIHKVAKR